MSAHPMDTAISVPVPVPVPVPVDRSVSARRSAPAGPARPRGRSAGWERWWLGALVLGALAWLLATIALPVASLLGRSFWGRHGPLHGPGPVHHLCAHAGRGAIAVQQPVAVGREQHGLRAAGLCLRLWRGAQLHAAGALVPGPGAGAAAGAFVAHGHQPDLSVRQPGPAQGLAAGGLGLRALRHHRGLGALDLSACADDPVHHAGLGRCAPVRGGPPRWAPAAGAASARSRCRPAATG